MYCVMKLFLKILLYQNSPDRYKGRRMCDKAVDSYLLAVKFVPNLFVLIKIIEKHDSAVFSDKSIVFGDLESDFFTIFSNDTGFNSITLDNSNLDDDSFDYYDPKTINRVRLVGIINLSNAKHLRKE